MARSLNRVQLIGNLGGDPEVRFTQDGRPIANLSVATSDTWNDKQGQRQERTEWHKVVIFGKLAEIAQQYLRKGSKVYLEGKLQTRKWTDNQGQERYTTEVMLSGFDGNIIMLDRPQGGGGYQAGGGGGFQGGGSGFQGGGPAQDGYDGGGDGGGYPPPPSGGGGFGKTPARSAPTSTPAPSADPDSQVPPDFDDDIPF